MNARWSCPGCALTLDAVAVAVAHRCPSQRNRWTEFTNLDAVVLTPDHTPSTEEASAIQPNDQRALDGLLDASPGTHDDPTPGAGVQHGAPCGDDPHSREHPSPRSGKVA